MKSCELCEGRKKVFGFGGMKKDCPRCVESITPSTKRAYVRKVEKVNDAIIKEI